MPFSRLPLRVGSLGLVLLLAGGLSAAAEEDVRISDFFRDTPGAAAPGAPRRLDGPSRSLEALLAGRPLPIPCATSLVLELGSRSDRMPVSGREALRAMSQRPILVSETGHSTRDGRFLIHFTLDPATADAIPATDTDFNGIPDRIDEVETALERAGATLVDRMGWPRPSATPRVGRLDIFLVNFGSSRAGLTAPDPNAAPGSTGAATSHILIDSRLEGGALGAAVIHQYAHASLLSLSTRAPAWWTEASAAWLESRVTADPSAHQEAIAGRLSRLDRSLTSDALRLSLGNYLWVSYLADRDEGGAALVRDTWQDLSRGTATPTLSLLDDALRRTGRGGLSEAFREYTRWSLFTGSRDDGDHFLMGGLLPEMLPRSSHESYPAEGGGAESLEPLGAAVHRLAGDGSRGGLVVRVDLDPGSPVEAELVIRSGPGGSPYRVELVPDGRGRAEAGIPWRTVREAMLIVRNTSTSGAAARYRFSAQMDPVYPFDLAAFSALSAPGGITLQWSTQKERDLLGWNVYRGTDPDGVFLRINPLTLPSGGDSEEETDYIYQDTTAPEGRMYYYFVEALTVAGLPERTFVLSARPAEPEPFP